MNRSGRRNISGRRLRACERYQSVAMVRTRLPHDVIARIDATPGQSQYARVRNLLTLGLKTYEAQKTPKQ